MYNVFILLCGSKSSSPFFEWSCYLDIQCLVQHHVRSVFLQSSSLLGKPHLPCMSYMSQPDKILQVSFPFFPMINLILVSAQTALFLLAQIFLCCTKTSVDAGRARLSPRFLQPTSPSPTEGDWPPADRILLQCWGTWKGSISTGDISC